MGAADTAIKIGISTAAVVTSAYLGSQLGDKGTLIGTALGSMIAGAATELYSLLVQHTRRHWSRLPTMGRRGLLSAAMAGLLGFGLLTIVEAGTGKPLHALTTGSDQTGTSWGNSFQPRSFSSPAPTGGQSTGPVPAGSSPASPAASGTLSQSAGPASLAPSPASPLSAAPSPAASPPSAAPSPAGRAPQFNSPPAASQPAVPVPVASQPGAQAPPEPAPQFTAAAPASAAPLPAAPPAPGAQPAG